MRPLGMNGGLLRCALAVLLLASFAVPTAVAAERVVLGEFFTATWCGYCSIAGPRLSQLMNTYPDTFAFVAFHPSTSDPAYTPYAVQRKGFYQVSGYPTSVFDGTIKRVGAQAYALYEQDYETRRDVPTDVTIAMTGQEVATNTYKVTTTVCMDGDGTAKDMRIYVAQVLDYWPYTVTYSRNGFKQIADTVDISLAPGECQEVVNTFTFDAESMAHEEDIRIIAWAQLVKSYYPAEVYQAGIMSWPFPQPSVVIEEMASCKLHDDGTYDAWFCLPMGLGDADSHGDNIEPRVGGVETLELQMSAAMDAATVVGAHVQVDCGSGYAGMANAYLDGDSTVVLEFDPALPNGDCCEVGLAGMSSESGVAVEETCFVAGLLGDVTRDGIVNSIDTSTIKPFYGTAPTDTSFVFDITLDNLISTLDTSGVKPYYGSMAPDCPDLP